MGVERHPVHLVDRSDQAQRTLAEVTAFAVVALVVALVQKLLFPLEHYWTSLVGGLLAHAVLQEVLIRTHLARNICTALDDDGGARPADALLGAVIPLAIAFALTALGLRPMVFVFPAVVLICLSHAALSASFQHWPASLPGGSAIRFNAAARTWIVCLAAAGLAYGTAFFSLDTKRPVNPRSTGDPAIRGVWFAIPVQKSEFFPAGYARLEDSISDDLGRIFVAEVGQMFGMVEACEPPGPSLERSVPSLVPGAPMQPRFNYAVDSMCPNWIATLPGFFWRIGLAGMFVLALTLGAAVFRSAIDFTILSLVLLAGWLTWPAPADIRMGNVAVLIAGMPLIAMIFPLFRRGRHSILVLWGLVGGTLFGLAAFVRRPCGQALLFTSIAVLIYLGLRQRRMLLALTAALALLIGSSLIPAAVNGMFNYRDERLQISAPMISPRTHGSGFPLLGGIGGRVIDRGADAVPEYSNALDVAFIDAAIWYVAFDHNPMIGLVRRSFTLMQQVSLQVFLRYVMSHPLEFALNLLRKAGDMLDVLLQFPEHWYRVPLILFGMLVLRRFVVGGTRAPEALRPYRLLEVLVAFLLLAVMTAAPAVLTSPHYGESSQLAAAVLSVSFVPAAHFLLKAAFDRVGVT